MQADPRIFFASERTLLAWVRAGVTIISLGFVVSRFGLFLRVLAVQLDVKPGLTSTHGYSNVLGIGLVLLGVACITVASIQHGRFIARLPEDACPAPYSRSWALWLSAMVALASVLLAVYLALTT